MTENRDLYSRLVVGQKRDGRRECDEATRDELVQLCLKPGVSIARTAMEYGINPNLLRSWIARHQRTHTAMSSSGTPDDDIIDVTSSATTEAVAFAFVSIVAPAPEPTASSQRLTLALNVRMPNGVELNFGEASLEELATLIQMLGRPPCSSSKKA